MATAALVRDGSTGSKLSFLLVADPARRRESLYTILVELEPLLPVSGGPSSKKAVLVELEPLLRVSGGPSSKKAVPVHDLGELEP